MAKRGEIGDFGDSGLLASRVPRRQPNWVVRGCCCVRAFIYLSIYLSSGKQVLLLQRHDAAARRQTHRQQGQDVSRQPTVSL